MAHVHWKLDTWLEQRNLTRYQLAKAMGGNEKSRLTTLYRMKAPKRIDLDVLTAILEGLERLTGEPVDVSELLEYQQAPLDEAMDADTQAWLESDLSHLGEFEPYDWGDTDPESLGNPVRYEPGRGLVVSDE